MMGYSYRKFVSFEDTNQVRVKLHRVPAMHASATRELNCSRWLRLLIPLARVHRGGWREWTRAAILPVESNVCEAGDGLLAIATAGGELAEQFANFCRKHLTLESWAFILDALEYETMVSEDSKSGCSIYTRPCQRLFARYRIRDDRPSRRTTVLGQPVEFSIQLSFHVLNEGSTSTQSRIKCLSCLYADLKNRTQMRLAMNSSRRTFESLTGICSIHLRMRSTSKAK